MLFAHQGWAEPVEFMHHCSTKWGTYLMSLKGLLEQRARAHRRRTTCTSPTPTEPGARSHRSGAGAPAVRRDRGLAVEPEPPRDVGGAADPDTRAGADPRGVDRIPVGPRTSGPCRAGGAPSWLRSTPRACMRFAGPRPSAVGSTARAATVAGEVLALDDLAGAQQHGGGLAVGADDDVAAEVHAVGEVDVEVAGRPEHHGRCAGSAHARRARPGRPHRRTPRPR